MTCFIIPGDNEEGGSEGADPVLGRVGGCLLCVDFVDSFRSRDGTGNGSGTDEGGVEDGTGKVTA